MLTPAQLRRAPKKSYMNDGQLEYFKSVLLQLKNEAKKHLEEAKQTLSQLQRENDDLDKAQIEEENRLILRIVERETILIRKIDESLIRIRNKEYGYCKITGEPIGMERLLTRPTATICADEKVLQEQMEKNFSDN